jgi:hypothetical protein
MAQQYTEISGTDGKQYRAVRCSVTGRLEEVHVWRLTSRRTGRHTWVAIWPKWNDHKRQGALPRGVVSLIS